MQTARVLTTQGTDSIKLSVIDVCVEILAIYFLFYCQLVNYLDTLTGPVERLEVLILGWVLMRYRFQIFPNLVLFSLLTQLNISTLSLFAGTFYIRGSSKLDHYALSVHISYTAPCVEHYLVHDHNNGQFHFHFHNNGQFHFHFHNHE